MIYRIDRNGYGYRVRYRPWWRVWAWKLALNTSRDSVVFQTCKMAREWIEDTEARRTKQQWVKNVCPLANGPCLPGSAVVKVCESAGTTPPCCAAAK